MEFDKAIYARRPLYRSSETGVDVSWRYIIIGESANLFYVVVTGAEQS